MTDKGERTTDTPVPDDSPAYFGFKTVPQEEKSRLVHGVFEKVAQRYDLMNDVMSAGMHRLWKEAAIDWLAPPRNNRPFSLIDVAGGTGDIAFRFLERAGPNATATMCDINEPMLRVSEHRAKTKAIGDRLRIICADAETLPFPDHSFDAYTIALGIRNVTRMEKALEEARRVLKPGGRFLCLEMSHFQLPGLEKLYDLYSFHVIPGLGRMVAGDGAPYQYLVESIRRFPDQETFAAMLRKTGFEHVKYRNLMSGIAAIHSGWRL